MDFATLAHLSPVFISNIIYTPPLPVDADSALAGAHGTTYIYSLAHMKKTANAFFTYEFCIDFISEINSCST